MKARGVLDRLDSSDGAYGDSDGTYRRRAGAALRGRAERLSGAAALRGRAATGTAAPAAGARGPLRIGRRRPDMHPAPTTRSGGAAVAYTVTRCPALCRLRLRAEYRR
jgi:hypothetical protein